MTPNDLDLYLKVLKANDVGACALELNDPNGSHQKIAVTFVPSIPEQPAGTEPTPGGWKSSATLDDPAALGREYSGELPT